MPRSAVRPLSLAGLALLAVLVVVLELAWPRFDAFPVDQLSAVCGLLASAACVVAAKRRSGRMRAAWSLFAVLMFCYAVGDALWHFYGSKEGTPQSLSPADIFYTGALFPAVVGLLFYPVMRSVRGNLRLLAVDALAVAAASLSQHDLPRGADRGIRRST